MDLLYYWSKAIKRLPGASIKNSSFEQPGRAEPRSNIINSSFGRYSYCGYYCTIVNTSIGRYCSIADNVSIGLANHPLEWVSTSPAFYLGKDSVPKDLAALKWHRGGGTTSIGNDDWIENDLNII